MPREFVTYINEWVREYGTRRSLAARLGLTASAFSRGIIREQTFGVETLLRFIIETGEPAGKVLRLAGKGELAELMERVYQNDGSHVTRAAHRELLATWNAMAADDQAAVLKIMRKLSATKKK